MDLPLLWFCLIALLWVGYLVLEGFDFGVGMLLPVLDRDETGARDDRRRRVMINTIAPVWDGNEVWLLVAGGATFAAFPEWYATMFSGFYLPLLVILVALIFRGLAFEYRGKINDDRWRARWDAAIVAGSYVTALIWGVAFANLVAGVPLDANHNYTGTVLTLLTPYALLGGLTFVALFAAHGAVFIALKTAGPIRNDAARLAHRLSYAAAACTAAFGLWTQLAYGKQWTWVVIGVVVVLLAALIWLTRQHREGLAFAASSTITAAAVVLIFGSLWPNVMPATNPAHSLTVTNASSTGYTLTVMTWVALALTPVVLLYQGWTYWVFRRRLTISAIPDHAGIKPRTPRPDPLSQQSTAPADSAGKRPSQTDSSDND